MDFSDIQASNVAAKDLEAIRQTGVAVVRGVMPRDMTEALLSDARQYFASHSFGGFPSNTKEKVCNASNHPFLGYHITRCLKVVYESYWSPSQVKARAHPNMLATQSWMSRFYTANGNEKSESFPNTSRCESRYNPGSYAVSVDLSVPLSYCDRAQIRPPGDTQFALSPHVDGGGVERWEDPAYNHVYRKVFQGKVRSERYCDDAGRGVELTQMTVARVRPLGSDWSS